MNHIKNELYKNKRIKNELYKKWNYKKWTYTKRTHKEWTYKKKNWSVPLNSKYSDALSYANCFFLSYFFTKL